MTHFIHKLFIAASLFGAIGASAGTSADAILKNSIHTPQPVANKTELNAPAAAPTSMVFQLPSYYAPGDDADAANYYIILTSKDDALYTRDNGVVMKDGFALFLDLYAPESTPIVLPGGTYNKSSDNTTMTFDPDYSYLAYYDADGNHNMSDEWTISNITVKKIAIGYTVTATVNYNGSSSVISYSGAIDMIDSRAPASVFNQIKSNLNLTLDGAYAVYDGNLYNSNTGSMYINLYDHAFNPETGGMIEDGFSLALQVFGKLFSDSSNATLDPGTYTVARNFSRYSWYPGTEIQYMGMTGLMGCYAKERNSVKYSDNYGYSYLSEGTIVIENMGDEVFKITVDAVTTLGHSVKGTFQGKVPVVDQSDDSKGSSISTLEDDVVLDIAKIKQGHLWNNGIKNGNQVFILDIGSPSGRDTELDNGGDIIRMEFVVPSGEKHLLPGTYTVMEEKWDSMYTPFKLAKGRFEGTSSGGTDLTGTRYMHFIEGRNYIMDHYAPAYYGTVGVSKNADGTYKFNIALVCDAYFHIDGEWEGPIELMYDPATGLDDITSDNNGLGIEFVNNSTLRVTGAETLADATLYTSTGIAIPCTIDGDCINISTLPYGVYILNVNGKTIKFIKR